MRAIAGVVTGIVKSFDDPQGQGRIELEFRGLPDGQRSGWAPIAAPLAGKSRGMYFMPEKEDEVLVAFERGDFAHPFIVGQLWNGVDVPPETDPENRIILTPGKHTLRFEDGNKKIVLQSAKGHEVVIDDSAQTLTVKSSAGQSMSIDDSANSLTLMGGNRQIKMANAMVQIS